MNTSQIVTSATNKLLERTIGMTPTELRDVISRVVNYTLFAAAEVVRDETLKEKIKELEVKNG